MIIHYIYSFSNCLDFASPPVNNDMQIYLAIVLDRPVADLNPGDLFLNDVDISNEFNQDAPFGYSSLTVIIASEVTYHLTTTSAADVRFAAYMYGFSNGPTGNGFGTAVGLSSIEIIIYCFWQYCSVVPLW